MICGSRGIRRVLKGRPDHSLIRPPIPLANQITVIARWSAPPKFDSEQAAPSPICVQPPLIHLISQPPPLIHSLSIMRPQLFRAAARSLRLPRARPFATTTPRAAEVELTIGAFTSISRCQRGLMYANNTLQMARRCRWKVITVFFPIF